MDKRCTLWSQVLIAFGIPFLLQGVAFFSPKWVEDGGFIKGLFYQCKTDNECSLHLLDQATIGLEGTSFVLAFLAVLLGVLSVCLYGPDEYGDIDNDEGCCYTFNFIWFYSCSVVMYPVNGILILSGCIRFGTLFHTDILGPSFYLCAIAGCLHFIVIFVVCCDACCKKKEDDIVCDTLLTKIYEDAV